MNQRRYLTILPSISAARRADGRIGLTEKFISGVTAYKKYWTQAGGTEVRVIVEPGLRHAGDLDEKVVNPHELPWEIELASYEKSALQRWLEPSAAVLLAGHYRQTPVGKWCGELAVPAVYTTECSLRTQLQMLQVERLNPLLRLRRKMWLHSEERRLRQAIAAAAGIQCNGTPTYHAYRKIARDSLLYFDSRVSESMLATPEALEQRNAKMRQAARLRLAFSGRLLAIKGADHLVQVATELARLGKKFELAICGAGPLENQMRAEVAARGLTGTVVFKGVLDFERELIPFVREHVDLFVCCHRQGDPSCTYLETMSCGVPIAGYDNEAFVGIQETSRAGWLAPMDRPRELVAKIAALTPDEIQEHSLRALAFARQHTFEKTFRARIDQLWRLATTSPENSLAKPARPST